MSINHDGKQECIDNKVIEKSYTYLLESETNTYDYALNTSLILMSTSIHLDGKTQIIDKVDEAGNPVIIDAIISRLSNENEFFDLRSNLKVALTNVAELPRGFECITR